MAQVFVSLPLVSSLVTPFSTPWNYNSEVFGLLTFLGYSCPSGSGCCRKDRIPTRTVYSHDMLNSHYITEVICWPTLISPMRWLELTLAVQIHAEGSVLTIYVSSVWSWKRRNGETPANQHHPSFHSPVGCSLSLLITAQQSSFFLERQKESRDRAQDKLLISCCFIFFFVCSRVSTTCD